MKLSKDIIVFSITTLAIIVRTITSITSITARDFVNSKPQYAPNDRDYPKHSVHKSTAAEVCSPSSTVLRSPKSNSAPSVSTKNLKLSLPP
jgi:hypothetical protein